MFLPQACAPEQLTPVFLATTYIECPFDAHFLNLHPNCDTSNVSVSCSDINVARTAHPEEHKCGPRFTRDLYSRLHVSLVLSIRLAGTHQRPGRGIFNSIVLERLSDIIVREYCVLSSVHLYLSDSFRLTSHHTIFSTHPKMLTSPQSRLG